MISIREIRLSDAKSFLELRGQLDRETKFMLAEPGERHQRVSDDRRSIERLKKSKNSAIFLAMDEKKPIGFIMAMGGNMRRIRHRAVIVIGILQAYVDQGIGARLFLTLISWVKKHGVHRLELTVMVHNKRGVALYKKMGFKIEGTRKKSVIVDGKYVDEYLMAKIV